MIYCPEGKVGETPNQTSGQQTASPLTYEQSHSSPINCMMTSII